MWTDRLIASLAGRVYFVLVHSAAALGHSKARAFCAMRRHPCPDGPFDLWVHCSSLGELETARPLLLLYSEKNPGHSLLVTFFSPSGFDAVQVISDTVSITALPWDIPSSVRQFLQKARPKKAVFIQYDLWPALMQGMDAHQIPWGVAFYKHTKKGGYFHRMLQKAHFVSTQTKEDEFLLRSFLPADKAVCVGDGRFDNVLRRSQSIPSFPPAWNSFHDLTGYGVFGSIWPDDASLILPLLARFPHLKWILAPHDVSEKNITFWEEKIPMPWVRFSKLSNETAPAKVILLDTVGHLFDLYSGAQFAYIGGGVHRKLHNILEPLAWNVPTAFASSGETNHWEAVAAVEYGCAASVSTPIELARKVAEWDKERPRAVDFIREHTGATGRLMRLVESLQG